MDLVAVDPTDISVDPIENPVEKQVIKYYSEMGKRMEEASNSEVATPKHSKILKKTSMQSSRLGLSQKYAQFFDFLKELHGLERNKPRSSSEFPFLAEIVESVLGFFNRQTNYTQQELQRYVIYLANLFNALGGRVKDLTFEPQFRIKIRKVFTNLVHKKEEGKCINLKLRALLYILAHLIQNERVNEVKSFGELNHSLYSDKAIVKLLLSLTLCKYKQMDKYYGIVMIHLSNQQNSKQFKEAIIKSILTNISKIDHESTFFNFLVYLRSERNQVKINYQDVLAGGLFDILINVYLKYIHKYQSFYVLGYLNHLLSLFPSLAAKIPENYITSLLMTATPANLHHPLHESTIITFVQLALKYAEPPTKNSILKEIIDFLLTNRHIALKLAHIIIDYEIDDLKIMQLLETGYFNSFLESINFKSEENLLKKKIELYKKIILKFAGINRPLSEYLSYQLEHRVKTIQERRENQVN